MLARRILLVTLLALTAAAAATYALLRRPETLVWASDRLAEATGQAVRVDNVSGSLLGVIHADRVRWRTHAGEVIFEDVDLVWSPLPLISGTVAFGHAKAHTARLFLRPPESAAPAMTTSLPVRLRFDEVAVGRFIVERRQPLQFLDASLRIEVDRDATRADVHRLRGYGGRLEGSVRVGHESPRAVGIAASVRPDGESTANGRALHVEATGTDVRLAVTARAEAAQSRLVARADLAPQDERPVRTIFVSMTEFNPRDFDARLPEARVRAELAAADDGDGLTGALAAFNARAGPISASRVPLSRLRATIEGDDEGWRMPALFFDLGAAGTLRGEGRAGDDGIALQLRAERIDPSRLHDDLARSRLDGTVTATIDSGAQRVRAVLAQKGARYVADATLEAERVRVDELRIEARGGRLRAQGSVAHAAPRAFEVAVELSRFDPSALGRYRRASINGSLTASGTLEPVLQTRGRVVVRPSNAFGLPASGRATWRSRGTSAPSIALDVDGRVGPTHVVAKGTLEDPANLRALDLALTIRGASLFDLTNVLGVPFPETTAPFRVDGRLAYDDGVWELRDFQGAVGRSDLRGRFTVDVRGARTAMRGDLVSERLDIRDLWGFVGADPRVRADDKLLPRGTFSAETLRTVDADVRYAGRTIVNPGLPLRSLDARLVMRGGEVALDPLVFRAAGGDVGGRVRLDARESPISAVADLAARDVSLRRLVPNADSDVATSGEVDGRVLLHMRGDSVAAMLGSANGDLKLVMSGGSVSDVALRLANLDLANALGAMLRGDPKVPIRCVVGDFEARDGVLRPRRLVLDTENTLLVGTGTVDLAQERLALRLVAEPKEPSLMSLRGPLRVGGTFVDPDVRPELGNAIARAGAAVALGAIAGPLAILPFLQIGERKEVDCGALVADTAPFVAAGPR